MPDTKQDDLENVIDRLGCGLLVVSSEGEIHVCNRQARRFLGGSGSTAPASLESFLAMLLGEHPFENPDDETKIGPWLAGLRPGAVSDRIAEAPGRCWYQFLAERDEGGSLYLTIVDVTTFKRREVLLVELHDRLAGEGQSLKRFAQDLANARSAAAEALRRKEQANLALEHEIAERRLLMAELRRLADTDPLTETFNRRRFMELAGEEIKNALKGGWRLAILMLDLDHFKAINDRFGHDGGDRALRHFAELVRQSLRPTAFLGRLGGEEFAVLLPNCDFRAALKVAERLRETVATSAFDGEANAAMKLTVSVGVAVLADGENSLERMIGRADRALYAAKNAGRDRVAGMDAGDAEPQVA